jgi:hypothetical protein
MRGLEKVSPFPDGYIKGLGLKYASATTITVKKGKARDYLNLANLSLTADVTVDISANGALGKDRKVLTGTAVDDGAGNLTGTGSAWLTELAPNNTPRALTGTLTIAGSSTTVTGSGTLFLSEVSIGDLIGNATDGYRRVTAIASNTSLTVVAVITITSSTAKCIEQAVIINGALVNSITSNTAMVASVNTGIGAGGTTIHVGVEAAASWYAVWLCAGVSGTTVILSTQRTQPFGLSGYNSYCRRIGWIRNGNGGDITAFTQRGSTSYRYMRYEVTAGNARLANGFDGVDDHACNAFIPPTSTEFMGHAIVTGGSAAGVFGVYPRGEGSTATYFYMNSSGGTSFTSSHALIPTDAAQYVTTSVTDTNVTTYLECDGFFDDLTWGLTDTTQYGIGTPNLGVLSTINPVSFVNGLGLSYTSATAIAVGKGSAKSSNDAETIALTAETPVAITSTGAGGLNTLTSSLKMSTTNSSTTATATGSVYGDLNGRALTGTASSSSTAVTGTGTKFLTEVSVGDMIRFGSVGTARVTAIASDTALTISAAPPGGAASSSTMTCYENVCLQIAAQTANSISTINDAGTGIVLTSNASATASDQAIVWGVETISRWYAVWVGQGGSGVTAFLSTQRTTPFAITGYTRAYRRVGWVRNNSSGDILEFSHQVATRYYIWECALGGDATTILSGGVATSWTEIVCSSAAPPTATSLMVNINGDGNAASGFYLRRRNTGSATTSRNNFLTNDSADRNYVHSTIICDGAQCIDYRNSSASNPISIQAIGFTDDLTVTPVTSSTPTSVAAPYPTGWIYRLGLSYTSATAIVVNPGTARSRDDAGNISLVNAVAVAITSTGAAGLNTKTSAATMTTTNASTTATASASVYSDLNGRTMTGTASSSGTAVTGTGTKFLTEVSVGDMIRFGSVGASRVTAIASDTALTISAAPPGGAASSSSMTCFENVCLQIADQTANSLSTIADNGTDIILTNNASATTGSQAIVWGVETISRWYAVWVGSGSSGTTAFLSTQRTTPYALTGYDSFYRRVGWAYNNSSGDVTPFSVNADREYFYEVDINTFRPVSNGVGATTTWTPYILTPLPPTARTAKIFTQRSGGSAGQFSFRARNTGSSSITRALQFAATTDNTGAVLDVPVDGAQAVDISQSAGTTGVYLDVVGFKDEV